MLITQPVYVPISKCMRHHDGTDDSAIEYAEWVRGDGLQRARLEQRANDQTVGGDATHWKI